MGAIRVEGWMMGHPGGVMKRFEDGLVSVMFDIGIDDGVI